MFTIPSCIICFSKSVTISGLFKGLSVSADENTSVLVSLFSNTQEIKSRKQIGKMALILCSTMLVFRTQNSFDLENILSLCSVGINSD